ncbi:MAG: type II secretion system GspH family protein [Solirubrobacteraceae bacterium]|jgi:general secretion pathway protein G|nr:type II secretion system GspH family protein [Solirubrobacteraceae bacterium]
MLEARVAGRAWSARAFTLIELVVVLAILGVLAAIAFPVAELATRRVREQELRGSLREMRTAIDRYKALVDEGRIPRGANESGYPKTLEILAAGVPDATRPNRDKIYLLRRIPRDPFHPDPTVAPGATWGKRSYASPPDQPEEGADVFDVYSLSEGVGLNGVPYREW